MIDDRPPSRQRCWTCWRPASVCLCGAIRPVETRSRFVLLMHPKEARRQRTGTGRLTRACLPNSEVLVGIDFSGDRRVNALIGDPGHRPVLLYPGGPPPGEGPLAAKDERPLLVFVLDGTWPAAKTMIRRSRNLRGLPRLSIRPAAPSRFSIKQQPGPLCLSTIESVHQVLEEANRAGLERTDGTHRALLDVLEELCRTQIACARSPHRSGYRRRPYRAPEERAPSRKWEKRKFILA